MVDHAYASTVAARSLQHGRERIAANLKRFTNELIGHCVACYVQQHSNTKHVFNWKCPSLDYGTCYNCQHVAMPDSPGHHLATKCPYRLRFVNPAQPFCYTCCFPPKMEDQIFHDGGWRGCQQAGLKDMVRPICWLLFRKYSELLGSIVSKEHMINADVYCSWLSQSRQVFFSNAMYVFYWFMEEGRHKMLDERSGREKRRRTWFQ